MSLFSRRIRPATWLTPALLGVAALLLSLCGGPGALAAEPVAPSAPSLKEMSPEVAALVKALESADAKDRAAAVDGLLKLGSASAPAIPKLAAALMDKSPEVRWRAARAVAEIASGSTTLSSSLMAGLKNPEPLVRAYSAQALGRLGDNRTEVAEALAPLLTDKEPRVRRAAIRTIRQLKLPRSVSIPLFVKTLDSADPNDAIAAVQTLAEAGAEAMPFLLDALKQPRAAYWASVAISEVGPPAKAAVPDLIKMLSSDEPELAFQACMALGSIGPDAKTALPDLEKILNAKVMLGVKYAAAFALGRIATPDDSAAMSALNKAGQTDDKFMQIVCAAALARLHPKDTNEVAKAVKLLIAALNSDDPRLRQASARALQELNHASAVAGPALLAALKDADTDVAMNAIDALGSLGPQSAPKSPSCSRSRSCAHRRCACCRVWGPMPSRRSLA